MPDPESNPDPDARIRAWHQFRPPKPAGRAVPRTAGELQDSLLRRLDVPPTAADAGRLLGELVAAVGLADPAYPGYVDRAALADRLHTRLAVRWPKADPVHRFTRAAEAVLDWWLGRAARPAAGRPADPGQTTAGAAAATLAAASRVAGLSAADWDELRRDDPAFYRTALLLFVGRTADEMTALGVPDERAQEAVVKSLEVG